MQLQLCGRNQSVPDSNSNGVFEQAKPPCSNNSDMHAAGAR